MSRYSLQQIFIESLAECESFKIIDGLNPFHIILNNRELFVYIKNLSSAYFTNPDVWRVQLPKKEEFEPIKDGEILCYLVMMRIMTYILRGIQSGQNNV